jgi:ribose transport system substrate-binding protein
MRLLTAASAAIAALMMTTSLSVAGPQVVSGPGAEPACFAPWNAETKYLQWEAKPGPYRIAVVNGFVGNTWRIQMIKTAKAFVEDPAVKDKIAEF